MKTTDNTRYNMESFPLSIEFFQKIANKELKDFQKEDFFMFPPYMSESGGLSEEQKIIEANSEILKTSNIMGIIGFKKEKLFIGSRFDSGSDYFFYYLLKRVLNFNFINLEVGAKRQHNYMDWLVYLFPNYLNEALKKGLYKEYRTFQYNDANVRGTIDVKRQIKDNVPFTGKIAYRSREFSYDNQLINLIRYTIEYIKKRKEYRKILTIDAVTRENVNAIEEKSQGFKKQGLNQVYSYNSRKPIRHTYFFEYQLLQKLCLSILNQETGIHESLSKDKVYGFLFDGAWLFEEYINLLIQDDFIHPQNKQRQNQQHLFKNQHNRSVGLIFPDFISKNENNRIIADAKYKPFRNISGQDYLQLVAYMYRFDSTKGFYLYPYRSDEKKSAYETFHLMQGASKETSRRSSESDISIVKLGIQIPTYAEDFREFEAAMKVAEDRFKNLIENQFSQ